MNLPDKTPDIPVYLYSFGSSFRFYLGVYKKYIKGFIRVQQLFVYAVFPFVYDDERIRRYMNVSRSFLYTNDVFFMIFVKNKRKMKPQIV